MSIKFILDNREHKLKSIFDTNSIEVDSKQLDLGDVLITYTPTTTSQTQENPQTQTTPQTIIFERKSYTDLRASMSDGRYHEQKSRYKQLAKGTCYYILENNDPNFKQLGKKQFWGTYVHTIIRDGIQVFLTNSIEETYELLISIGDTIKTHGILSYGTNSVNTSVEITQIKKKKSTGIEIFKEQLCCLKGVSSGKADLILKEYKCMKSLIMALENDTFKIKGIGNVLINNIKNGLFR